MVSKMNRYWKILEKDIKKEPKVKIYGNKDVVFPIHKQNLKLSPDNIINLINIKIIAIIKKRKDGYLTITQKSVICTRTTEVDLTNKEKLIRGEDISTYTGDILYKEFERLNVNVFNEKK